MNLLVLKPKGRAKLSDAECAAIYREAHASGQHAVTILPHEYEAFTQPDGRKLFRIKTAEHGVAYVQVPGGSFRTWAGRQKLTGTIHGDKIWVTQYNSDLASKVAYANAFAHVLHLRGINATVHTILD